MARIIRDELYDTVITSCDTCNNSTYEKREWLCNQNPDAPKTLNNPSQIPSWCGLEKIEFKYEGKKGGNTRRKKFPTKKNRVSNRKRSSADKNIPPPNEVM